MLNARGSEVAGLEVGDIHWVNRIVKIERQVYPGKGGLVRKQTKGCKDRYVPILDPSAPSSSAFSAGKDPAIRRSGRRIPGAQDPSYREQTAVPWPRLGSGLRHARILAHWRATNWPFRFLTGLV